MSLKTISVKVNDQNPIQIGNVSYDSSINVKVNDQQDYKVKTVNLSANKLSNMTDVNSKSAQQDNLLIYNEITSIFEAKQLNMDFGEY